MCLNLFGHVSPEDGQIGCTSSPKSGLIGSNKLQCKTSEFISSEQFSSGTAAGNPFGDVYVFELLRCVQLHLRTATLSNSHVKLRVRCVMLRFVAIPKALLFLYLTLQACLTVGGRAGVYSGTTFSTCSPCALTGLTSARPSG
jgi:hypothetical protein